MKFRNLQLAKGGREIRTLVEESLSARASLFIGCDFALIEGRAREEGVRSQRVRLKDHGEKNEGERNKEKCNKIKEVIHVISHGALDTTTNAIRQYLRCATRLEAVVESILSSSLSRNSFNLQASHAN